MEWIGWGWELERYWVGLETKRIGVVGCIHYLFV